MKRCLFPMAVIIKKERKYRHGNKTGYLFIHILWSVIKLKENEHIPAQVLFFLSFIWAGIYFLLIQTQRMEKRMFLYWSEGLSHVLVNCGSELSFGLKAIHKLTHEIFGPQERFSFE